MICDAIVMIWIEFHCPVSSTICTKGTRSVFVLLNSGSDSGTLMKYFEISGRLSRIY